MQTILEILNKTESYLQNKGVDNPRFEAELILAGSLNLNRIDLYTQFDRTLNNVEIEACRHALKKFNKEDRKTSLKTLLDKGNSELQQANIENAGHDAAELLSHVTDIPRLELSLNHDNEIDHDIALHYDALIKRRVKREPLQYIIGRVHFYNLEINVNRQTLIPRPETEQMIDHIVQHHQFKENDHLLDIGTGTGCIALALKHMFKTSKVTAIDKFVNTLDVASKNMHRLDLDLALLAVDFMDETGWEHLPQFSFIVSNPPYVTKDEYPDLQPELTVYEPKLALTDEGDGLAFYRKIISFCDTHLKPGHWLYLEHGDHQQKQIIDLITKSHNFEQIKSHRDLNQRDRFISAQRKN